VAYDYKVHLAEAIGKNYDVYKNILYSKVKSFNPSLSSGLDWKFCYLIRRRSYLDCPIEAFDFEDGYSMHVIIHNPSIIRLNHTAIKVPNG